MSLYIWPNGHPILRRNSITELTLIEQLKVSKFQKQIFFFSFEQKNEQNYFFNSAVESNHSQIKKNEGITIRDYLMLKVS